MSSVILKIFYTFYVTNAHLINGLVRIGHSESAVFRVLNAAGVWNWLLVCKDSRVSPVSVVLSSTTLQLKTYFKMENFKNWTNIVSKIEVRF